MSRRRRTLLVLGAGVVCLPCCLLLPCAYEIRDGEGWVRSAARLREVGWGFQAYHDAFGRLPPAVVRDQDGRPLYSWRVALLPYVEQDALYKQFHLDEPWDSPHNAALTRDTPRCYDPHGGGEDDPGLTRFQVFVGPGTAFERDGLTWADFPDGLGNTLLVAESANPVPWAKPVDLAYSPDQPLPSLACPYTKPVKLFCYTIGYRPGFAGCFADGKTRFVPHSAGEAIIRALITRNGGEPVEPARFD
jgi:hypothetical protein